MDGIGAVYGEGRERLSQLVVDLSDDEAETPVPACPAWTVRDVVAHLAGSCADVVAGNLDGVTTAPWADAQVSQRRGRTTAELVGEWSAIAPGLEAMAHRFPARMASLWVLDLTAHEHDVRGALGRPGARQSRGLDTGLELLVSEGLHSVVALSLGPLAVRTPRASWVVGAGSPATPTAASVDERATPEPVAALDASSFELFRALTGRRSSAQIARMAWSGDPGPFVPAFEFGTFTTRPTDLVE